MATPHNEANINEIAKTVLMPGDPLRAKYIAETYLDDYKLVNKVRNIYAYTGKYKGKEVTIMASGMGMPSMGIYSYELFKFYDVDNIIRIGTAGAYTKDLNLYDVVLVEGSYSESSFAKAQNGCLDNILYSNKELNKKIEDTAEKLNINVTKSIIHSSDIFYKENDNFEELLNKYGCKCVEMESFALFHNANVLNKKAACILTISDNLVTHEETTAEERQNSFNKMIELALESIL
ncbi:MAG: purine-nucleoside phosphorylase [Bacilli bacterium]|nr:purine-nucleoside phosphorylase [Bacilli bacterium]MBO6194800.1 purine-nucleoside phosphorylase [Bacilli bacterium]